MTEAILAGLFGLLIGSFLNVCIHRLPRDESVVWPGSHCPSCSRPIAPRDNIPVLSWLILRGRCRSCGTAISSRYLLVEVLTGALFAGAVLVYGPTLAAAKSCIFVAIMIALIFTDLEERILPDEFTLGGAAVGAAFSILVPLPEPLLPLLLPDVFPGRWGALAESCFSAGLLALVLWAIGALYLRIRGREGLGFGDVKMVACIGAFLGLSASLLALAAGSVLGSIAGILWIRVTRKDPATFELPFGSFLGIGAVVVTLFPSVSKAL